MAVEHGETPTEYIAHHLTHLKVGSGFWTWHIDTLFMSLLLAIGGSFLLWLAARQVKGSTAPTGFAGFVEWVYDWVDSQVADIYQGDRRFMTALAGNLPGYEEATRALYAADPVRFDASIAQWPTDVREHTAKLAARALSQ